MKKTLRLFAQIAKVDATKREVSGIATAEVVDKDGEIFDYKTSKPFFEKWSAEISKATDGKSLGNVREMHEPSAVGKLVDITFDDEMKQIRVGAKIVDNDAWEKCEVGVYTGFSIGGKYEKAWKDGEFVRFTANPVEISVVDNPCVPTAHFTAVKADGTCEVRKFAQKAMGHSPTVDKNTVAPVKKDMCSVGDLAYMIANISCIQGWLEDEAIWEGDDSPVPAKLATWINEGVAILHALLDEEGTELTDGEKLFRAEIKKMGSLGSDKFPIAVCEAEILRTAGINLPESVEFIRIWKDGFSDAVQKAGAKHSAETKAHHAAIAKAVGTIGKAAATAKEHSDALMGKDMEDVAHADMTKKVPAEPEPTIEVQESTMLEATEKQQLEKASADSASSLSKIAEVESKMATKDDMKAGFEKLAEVMHKFVQKFAGSEEGGENVQKVARTAVPTVTVTKEGDNGTTQAGFQELPQEEIEKLSPAKRAEYVHKATLAAMQAPQLIKDTPRFLSGSR